MALSSMLCSAVTMLAQPPVQPIRPIPRPRPSTLTLPLSRENFPFDFTFGASTSALQIEGASNNHCKGPNIWDDFILKFPEKIKDRSNIENACNSYEHFREDIRLLKQMNMDAYRFSISWSRILPKGKLNCINKEGIEYYLKLLEELEKEDLDPYVTIFHFDLPQALQEKYGGVLGAEFIDDYVAFADLCFEKFGKKVKKWITMNEPLIFCNGYTGSFPPLRSSEWQNIRGSVGGDAAVEPYIASHNLLLAHAAAVKRYRDCYKNPVSKEEIGITLNSAWYVPYSDHKDDKEAALRALDFSLGLYLNPITYGDYPESVRSLVGNRLPKFTQEQSDLLRKSYDFIGLNYYHAYYAANDPTINNPPSFKTDSLVRNTTERDGKPIGTRAASPWLHSYPKGIKEMVCHIKDKYNNPAIYITENGMDQYNDPDESLKESLMDISRVDYIFRHLYHLNSAIKEHDVNVKGYFIWSLVDTFEFLNGYTIRFGLNFVDFEDKKFRRYPKYSAQWLKNFLDRKRRPQPPYILPEEELRLEYAEV